MKIIEIKVPDIGDFENVEVIEIICKENENVKPEDPLISLESDKATMDIPSPMEGVIHELNVKLGDKVSEGSLILKMKKLIIMQKKLYNQPFLIKKLLLLME